ncbi:MAG: hypothetical protein HYX34_05160 [Actinobacteria bacterium]|nr:hypothetical protein [Actinomycetota bacterium]
MLLIRLAVSPVRIALLLARLFGYGRLAVFLLGVAAGLLLAPTTGAELRSKLRDLAAGASMGAGTPPAG